MREAEEVLNFWFGAPTEPGSEYGQQRKEWFVKNPDFDRQIRTRFLSLYEQAATGHLNHWREDPRSCLALILLLDQFSRNMFRGTPQAFATDPQALAAAQLAIARQYRQQLIPVEEMFLYLPLEHSENLEHQQQCVDQFQRLQVDHPEFDSVLDYAIRHKAVIERFGRFPHRNAILGRESTPEELTFLQQPGSSF